LALSFFSPSSGVLSSASAAVLHYVNAAVEAAEAVVLVETAVRNTKMIILESLPPHTVAINQPRPQWPMAHPNSHPNTPPSLLLSTILAGKSMKTVSLLCPVGTLLRRGGLRISAISLLTTRMVTLRWVDSILMHRECEVATIAFPMALYRLNPTIILTTMA